MLTDHQERWAINPRMAAFKSLESCARKTRQHFWLRHLGYRNSVLTLLLPKTHFQLTPRTHLNNRIEEFSGYDINFTAALESDVFKIGMHGDAEVGRERPRCRRPDQHEDFTACQRRIDLRGIACQWKLDVHRRTLVLMVLNFRFGERCLIVDAPVNGACAFVHETALDKPREQTGRLSFVMVRHRDVGVVPFA